MSSHINSDKRSVQFTCADTLDRTDGQNQTKPTRLMKRKSLPMCLLLMMVAYTWKDAMTVEAFLSSSSSRPSSIRLESKTPKYVRRQTFYASSHSNFESREEASSDSISRREICLGAASTAVATIVCLSPLPSSADTDTDAIGSTDSKQQQQQQQSFQVSLQVQLDESNSTSNTGEIVIEVLPEWAPLAATRFRELLDDGYFQQAKFFRVLPGYVAQFGIAADPKLNQKWMFDKQQALRDEPRLHSNTKGTLSFASSGKNSRQTQIFINLGNNGGPPNFLDAQGFVPFARIVKGMDEVVPKLYSGYGVMESVSAGMAGSVNQAKAAYYGNEYLDALFPKLSTIIDATTTQQSK